MSNETNNESKENGTNKAKSRASYLNEFKDQADFVIVAATIFL